MCSCPKQYFKENPDCRNPSFNTKYGVYSEGCGLDNVMMSWGHDDYMYMVNTYQTSKDLIFFEVQPFDDGRPK